MGITNIYMIKGFGVDLGELWRDIGFLGWDTWVFEIFMLSLYRSLKFSTHKHTGVIYSAGSDAGKYQRDAENGSVLPYGVAVAATIGVYCCGERNTISICRTKECDRF